MALADAAELGGTFGIPATQIRILMAGGVPVDAQMPGDTEDDTGAAGADAAGIGPGDLLIALTASGSTPYPLELARIAAENGALVVAIANNPGARIFAHADVAICLETPPEVIAGSTRLGAGTAQKAALNLMSTLMGVRLGHVHDGLMVNVIADNEKLRARAMGIVCQITGCTPECAAKSIAATNGAVKPAVLLAAGAQSPEAAMALLTTTNGNLRAALTYISGP
jgi:N-acetylmuramic acid 6-phosphate etherase